MAVQSLKNQGPFRVAACWPHQQAPFILSLVGGGDTFIPTSFSTVTFDSLRSCKLKDFSRQTVDVQGANTSSHQTFSTMPRWFFLLPYEYFAYQNIETTASRSLASIERPLAWKIEAGLYWHAGDDRPHYVAFPNAHLARFHLDYKREIMALLADAQAWAPPPKSRPMVLLPTTSDKSYLESVAKIIHSIKNGSFYQVNLLRYFQAHQAHGWQNLCARMEHHSGPEGVLIAHGSRVISSFSPERFIHLTSTASNQATITTWPIKGTAARNLSDDHRDQMVGESLNQSPKDHAELNMIIDLMRNDLAKICLPQTVNVINGGRLAAFKHVWHLEGEIQGHLSTDTTLGQLLSAICPAGSITGAPKKAAIQRIAQDESDHRGFFMGNFFRINGDGSMASNVMIRTLVSDDWVKTARYAAGGGIVVKSDPPSELQEVIAKCQPLTSP